MSPSLQGQWALPGGFVDQDEPLDRAAARELQEETSVDPSSVLLEQVQQFCINMLQIRVCCVLYTSKIEVEALCCSCTRQSSAGTATRERSLGIIGSQPCSGSLAGWSFWRPGAGPARLVRVGSICRACAIDQHGRQGRGAPAHTSKHHCCVPWLHALSMMPLVLKFNYARSPHIQPSEGL